MNISIKKIIIGALFLWLVPSAIFASESNGTINTSYKYGWGENFGWINFAPTDGSSNYHGLTITDSAVTGYAWSETYGWINFSPSSGGVTNSCTGQLGGWAWSTQLGWISMAGVVIGSTGEFSGVGGGTTLASGRITFDCDNCDVRTDWIPCADREEEDTGGGGGTGATCSNGASDYPTCTPPPDPTCSNGASDYPTCTPPTPPFCSNGASDYPTCTPPPDPTCSNGASDYPTCTPPQTPTCSNGASDYPTCTPPTPPLDPVCSNGALDYPTCSQPPDPTCSNGASDYPTCTDSSNGGGEGDTEDDESDDTGGEENTGGGGGGSSGGGGVVAEVATEIISNITDSVGVVTDATVAVLQDVGEVLVEIPGVQTVVDVAQVAIERTEKVINNPTVEKIDEVVSAPVLTATAVVNVVVGGATLFSQILIFLRLLFLQPLLLLFKRHKQKTWGTVFNSHTKQPLDLAMVRLVQGENDKIVRTQVTDAQGRYFMAAGNGTYILKTTKEGFGPHKSTQVEDSVYPNLYYGEKLDLADKESELNYNIPLEPVYESKSTADIVKEYSRKAFQKTLSMVGAIATVVSLIISPNIWMAALLVVHLLIYVVMKRFAQKKVKGDRGIVVNSKTNKPMKKVVIRVFDNAYNKLVDTTITDTNGRYVVLVGPSTYYITAEKEGYTPYQSDTIDLTSEKTNGIGGVITENFSLVPVDEKKK